MSDQDNKPENDEQESMGAMSWAKKLMTVGVGTFFLSEEALKTLVAEFKLPKDIVLTMLDGAKNVRKEFMQNVVSEMMGRIQDRVDPGVILADFLKKNEVTFEIKMKVKDRTKEPS
jgi:hypothetical protein